MLKMISFVKECIIDTIVYISIIVFLCLTMNNGMFLKDIKSAFRKDWKVGIWLIISLIFFYFQIFHFNNMGAYSLICNIFGFCVLAIFVNFITREYSNVQFDKIETKVLDEIKVKLKNLKTSNDPNDLDEILNFIDNRLQDNKFKIELNETIQELKRVENKEELFQLAKKLVNDGFEATASTSGLTEYIVYKKSDIDFTNFRKKK